MRFGSRTNEQCWILVGKSKDNLWWGRRRYASEGEVASVRFDPAYVMQREEDFGDIVGFFHTHPQWPAIPSSRDDRTMKGWVASFGKPLICVIRGTDGLRGYWYMSDEDPPVERQVISIKNYFTGITF